MRDTTPILIDCVGSGCRGHGLGDMLMCSMCGALLKATDDGKMPAHQRDDILARIERGDFRR